MIYWVSAPPPDGACKNCGTEGSLAPDNRCRRVPAPMTTMSSRSVGPISQPTTAADLAQLSVNFSVGLPTLAPTVRARRYQLRPLT
ncbi:hypothetical protein M514_08195 [Trichuris suis]|uniref:Uncharacterized protein n=1 Tax=Trichuris suis TaxID=68888 RepID=A0A085M0Y6_9BILA|nr:hypothetical protein M513_08195 [Trichuris suis]KFD65354.1 hypothetical protein M514_08195 [Trichuris suis]